MRPVPAPTTWMIEEHSALPSISETPAFWTLRIFPRSGRIAWNSLLRASLPVPSAESPSTSHSSDRETSVLRQSASLAGRVEVSSAVLRRAASLLALAACRVCAAAAILSRTVATWALRLLSSRKWVLSPFATTSATILRTPGVPSSSLVWPRYCGSGTFTVTTAVRPSSTSSLTTSSSLTLSTRLSRMAAFSVLSTADSKPLWWLPPWPVATTLQKLCTTVS